MAVEAMAALESGAIANPDEGRRVGHYWLRAPELAPEPEMTAAITGALQQIRDFAVKVHSGEVSGFGARNFSQCDSMLIGEKCGAHTFPYIDVQNPTARMEHEASTSKIGEDQIFYCNSRGIETEDAVSMIVNGFCKEVFKELPMEFAVEAQKLLSVSLEGSVG